MRKILISSIIIFLVAIASVSMAAKVVEEDKNKDGKPDSWIYYDDNSRPVKIESDRNFDGKIDLWIEYGAKGARVTKIDMNFDGRPDMYSYYRYGQRVKLEMDTDYDGKLDQINDYADGKLVKMQRANKNKELETVFDITSRYSSQEKHTQYYENDPKALQDSKTLPKENKAQ
jgi:hypothetical protein